MKDKLEDVMLLAAGEKQLSFVLEPVATSVQRSHIGFCPSLP